MSPRTNDPIELEELADLLRRREGPPRPVRHRRARGPLRLALVIGVLAVAAATGITLAIVKPGSHDESRPSSGGSGSASCAAVVEWRGTTYLGTAVHRSVRLGRSLGDGMLPPCNDTSPGSGGQAQSVSLAAVGDIPPRQAVALTADPSIVYVAPGYFPEIPGTALHDLLYGPRSDVPNERSGCGESKTDEVQATADGTFGTLHVTSGGFPRDTLIFVDALTRIEGGGLEPHVAPGDEIRAQVRVCRHRGDPHFLKLVATRLFLGKAAGHR
jgi:hypothetical protein